MNDILTEKQYQAELLGILRDQNGFTIRNAADFDRRFALDREMLFGFLNDTQPETMEKLRKIHKDRLEVRSLALSIPSVRRKGAV